MDNYDGATGTESQTVSLSNADLGTFMLTYDGQATVVDYDYDLTGSTVQVTAG